MSFRSGDEHPLAGINCEWCWDEPATVRVPILRKIKGTKGMTDSGTAVYACSKHERIAKESARSG